MEQREIKNVTDVIDLSYLQKIQDSLGRITGITTALLDPDGIPLSRATNLHAFCAMMQASESGVQMCIRANHELIRINRETREPAVVTCPNSGLKTAAVPIFLGEQYLGSWLIGQLRMENIDEALIEKTAAKAGISSEEAKQNIAMLPLISDEEFDNILDFLRNFTDTTTDMVKINAALMEKNEKLKQTTEDLDISLKAFRDFIDLSDLGVYLVDYETGKLLMYNEFYKNLAKATSKPLEGSCCYEQMGQEDFCSFCPRDKLLDEKGDPTGPYEWEQYLEPVDKWLSITSRALRWVDGRLAIMTTFVDITKRKKEEERILYLAYHDQQLNVPNVLKLNKDLWDRPKEKHDLICFDVQGLREINDVYGRDAGDSLLRSVAAEAGKFRDTELYRIDGDQFAIRMSAGKLESAAALAKLLYERFDVSWEVDMGDGLRQSIYTGVHMGYLETDKPFTSYAALINMMERVLSFARKENKLILYDERMDKAFEGHLQFEMMFKSSVLNGMQGFSLNYQPIVDVATGKWKGLEALCRWNSPALDTVPPDIFIKEAEKLGLIHMLSAWVFDEAIRQMKEWKLDMLPDFMLDVNLSAIQLRDNSLVQKVMRTLQKYNYPPHKLSLEVTETAEIHFDERTLNILHDIRAAGISLSLDDFGTGYATFSNLRKLPVKTLKTDRSFVTGIEEDPFLQHTVRMMVEFAHAADLTVIAEGVETEGQRRIIEKSGVNMIQGYFFSRPLTAQDLSQKLDHFR